MARHAMNIQLIIAAVIAASSFIGGWTIQSWRHGAKETARAQQILVDQRLAAATAIRRSDNVIEAQSAAAVRAVDLRRAADGSRAALVGLHDAAASALRAASASQAACLERATALSELLGTVATAGGDLAEKADRHANDVRTLSEAWPK